MTVDAVEPDEFDAWVRAGTTSELRQMLTKLRWADRAATIERIDAAAATADADHLPARAALLRFIQDVAEDVQHRTQVQGEGDVDALLARAWDAAPGAVDVYLLLRHHPEAITEQALDRARHMFFGPTAHQPDADKGLCVLAVLGVLLRDPGHGAQAHLMWQGILQHGGNLPGAAHHLARARALAERAKDAAAIEEIDLAMARLLERTGDLAEAVARYESILAGHNGDDLSSLPVLERLADSYRQLGKPGVALAKIDLAIPLIRHMGDPERLLTAMNFRGLLLEDGGDYLAGGEQFSITAASARAAGLFDLEFKASTNAAMSLLKRQRWTEAVDRYQQVLLRARASGQQDLIDAALNNLGQALMAAGRPADAARQFAPAMMSGIAREDNARAGFAAIGLSDAYDRLGETESAANIHRLAGLFVLQSGMDELYTMWVTRLPRHEPDPAVGLQALRAAYATAQQAQDLPLELGLIPALVANLERGGQDGEAESLCAHGAEAALRADPHSPWGFRFTTEQARFVAKDPGRAADAYRLVEEGSRLADQRMERAATDLARSEIAADLVDLIGLKIDLLYRHGKQLVPVGAHPAAIAFDAHQMAKSPLLVSVLARGGGDSVAPADAAEVASLLDMAETDAALVSFFIDDRQTACFVLRAGDTEPSCTLIDVGRAEIESAVAGVRRAFNGSPREFPPVPPIRGDQPWKRPLTALDALSERLLSFLPQVRGAALICIAPHGPLHLLPWPALRMPDGRYLVEEHGVAIIPAATMLRYMADGKGGGRTGRRRALVAGVSAAGDRHPEYFEHDADLMTGYEITDLSGLQATKDAVIAGLAGRDVVHLTCHGFFDSRRPLESGVVLSDGETRPPRDPDSLPVNRRGQFVLTAGELLGQPLSADLTVLRACVSGVQHVQNAADELQGLATSLLSAGSAAALVSLWNVDQRSSRELLRQFYENWLPAGAGAPSTSTSTSKWQALAETQRAFINGPDGAWRHPYHWAPLTLIGDWR